MTSNDNCEVKELATIEMTHQRILSPAQQLLFAVGSAGFNLLERLIVLYVPFYFLPPAEYGISSLVPEEAFWGVATVLGMALVVGRVFDAFADPVIAAMSDRSISPLGRRRVFLLCSGLPLALFGALIFFPPFPGQPSVYNGVWLGVTLSFFYIAYTGYVNPYLALISDLGETEDLRLKLGTKVAIFGMIATLAVTAGLPELVNWLSSRGFELRNAYQTTIILFSFLSVFLLYAATCGLREPKRTFGLQPQTSDTWRSLSDTFTNIPFRTYVLGEMLLQYALNLMTMGLLYYIVVIFQKPTGFMALLAGIMAALAAISIPIINIAARRYGKKLVFIAGLGLMILCSTVLFVLSFNMTGLLGVIGFVVLAMVGIPLTVFAILISPTIAQMARNHTLTTGVSKEAMFFAARAIPVKFVIAAAGATFSFLLATFGKDIARPLGVQLSLLVIAIASAAALLMFCQLPDDRLSE